jgi:hypothetical protein
VPGHEAGHQGRAALGDLAEDPADRLADEELPLAEHRRREAREAREVAAARPERGQEGEQRAPADPEVAVPRPPVQALRRDRRARAERGDHVDGQPVHVGPRPRLHDQALEEPHVARDQAVPVAGEEADPGRPQLVDGPGPQPLHQPDEIRPVERPVIAGERPHGGVEPGRPHAEELEVALQVRLLRPCPRRAAEPHQRGLQAGDRLLDVKCQEGSGFD